MIGDEEIYPSVLTDLEIYEGGRLTNFAIIASYAHQIQEMVEEARRHIKSASISTHNIEQAIITLSHINAESAIESGILPILSRYCFDSGITGDGSANNPFNLWTPTPRPSLQCNDHPTITKTLRIPTIPCTNSPEPIPVPPISQQRGIPSSLTTSQHRVSFAETRQTFQSPLPGPLTRHQSNSR
ncbi:hypothetical protein EW145_g2930 [Phellinidium pouzarii]|uniref:Uncharacterized protein n=1 Tax=Phellinidium pouzarii TaxID=167371 RepID=A0A4S4L9H2_9AGAM|nr:hypothetical protein EW145_g2930 [Phellinidium pouzarii]